MGEAELEGIIEFYFVYVKYEILVRHPSGDSG